MITHEDQLDLLKLISNYIGADMECYAFGGNAMMFYGYKEDTKEIDFLFEDNSERSGFIKAIQALGYEETSPIKIFIPEKLREKDKPVMFMKGEARFDLFVKRIFRTQISPKMKEDLYAVHDFRGKNTLRVKVLRKEHLVLLKAVTERDKDFEDILTILQKEKHFDWQYLVDEAVWQHEHGDSWVLLDLEKTLLELKKYVFVEQKYLKQIYASQGKKEK